ncbi:MAG: xanthine dehydrogenase family protein molybdopterin-binding subunit [Candidatus Caldarchaeum sp.]|nr:xanthine dehydrogenase family protein molybdopterin-binding subunit [Candidatus Caldarchaeum sp.]
MVSRVVGSGVRLIDGGRFVTGLGRYVDDVVLPLTVYGVFVRSRYAHAKITSLKTTAAMKVEGAVAVITGEDVKNVLGSLPKIGMQGLKEPSIFPFAVDKVTHVGEPLALCLATNPYAANDMADLVEVSYKTLPAVTDPEEAATNKTIIHEELGDNIALKLEFKGGDLAAAFSEADTVIKRRIRLNRTTAASMEPRGTVASYNQSDGRLEVWTSTQFPHILRTHLARYFNIPENRVRVNACDVGGGFGMKAHIFREDLAVCYASMKLGRPVKWFEDRAENFQSSVHEREQVHYVEIACKRDGTVLAVKDRCYADLGAFGAAPWGGGTLSMFTSVLLPGPYKLKAYSSEHIAVYTNKAPYGAVRGPALIQANYVIERVMDIVARELGLDPAEVRLKNLIKRNEQPFTTVSGQVFNSSSFDESLTKLLSIIEYEKLREMQKEARNRNVRMGIGFSILAEYGAFNSAVNMLFGMGGFDSVKICLEPTGKITVYTGLVNIGQGITTALAQLVADKLQVSLDNISIVAGDTLSAPYGIGSHSSRSAIIGGNAAAIAADRVLDKMRKIAAAFLEADPRDIEYSGGRFYVKDLPSKSASLEDVARMAYVTPHKLPKDMEPAVEATCYFEPASGITWANAAHAAIVEVDVESGHVKVKDYYVVEDCGNVINSEIVKGQVVGGVVMGIGHVLYEDLKYDENGLLLNSGFSDYLIPSAVESPNVKVYFHLTPAVDNPGGYKGVGEGGTIAAPAAVANAIEDALSDMKAKVEDAPLSPNNVWQIFKR